jgi:hypothetical protein
MNDQCSCGAKCGCGVERACGHPACESRRAESCLTERAVETWTCAGHQAWKEVHVDILKTKILKAWGPQMERTADAVIEAMGVQWKAALAQVQAKADLKQKIGEIFGESRK